MLVSCRVLLKHNDNDTTEECFVNNCKQSAKLIAFLGSECILTWFKMDNDPEKNKGMSKL